MTSNKPNMRAIVCFVASAVLAPLTAFAQPVLIQGEELKAYAVGEKGRTLTIADGEKITFFPDGTFLDCNPKGFCDKGSYAIEPARIVRLYDKWQLNGERLADPH